MRKCRFKQKIIAVILTAALLTSGITADNANAAGTSVDDSGVLQQAASQGGRSDERDHSAVWDDLEEGTYVEHEVIVTYDKRSVRQRKGQSKSLRSVRKDSHIAGTFGSAMMAVNEAGDIVKTVDAQKDILSEALDNDYVIKDSIDFDDFVVSLVYSGSDDTKTMLEKLEGETGVREVTPNYNVKVQSADFSLDDEYIDYCYSLGDETTKNVKTGNNIYNGGTLFNGHTKDASMHVTDLWKANEGKQLSDEDDIVVAVIDTGIDYTHEELKDHMWDNPGDIGLLGKYGYDFENNDDDPMDDNDHGTHCAGIIAASADNGAGISGVAGRYADHVKLMALKVMDEDGGGSGAFPFIGAFRYVLTAVENGVPVKLINNSWGLNYTVGNGRYFDDILGKLGEYGVLSFHAASNEGADLDYRDSSILCSSQDNMVCVGALDQMGEAACFSNYGKSQVDVFTPGCNILSSICHDNYLPVIYSEDRLKKTTHTYGIFDEGSCAPVSGVPGLATFGEPVILNESGEEVTEGVTLSVTDERYMNSRTKKSLKAEIENAKKGEQYYIFFPYKTEKKADGTNVTLSAYVGTEYDKELEEQGAIGFTDMLRYEDGSVRVNKFDGCYYSNMWCDSMNGLKLVDTFSYTESAMAASHGIAILYQAITDAPATLYIDGLAVSRAGIDSSLYGKYGFFDGTSMACPNAVGAAALIALSYPDKIKADNGMDSAIKLKNLLYSTVTRTEQLRDICTTGGFVDLSKIASGSFSPVISSVKVDTEADTVIINGANFGDVKGSVSAERVVCDTEGDADIHISAEDIISWDDSKIVIKDAKNADGSYTLRGHYLYFNVQTDSGDTIRSAYYTTDGIRSLPKLNKHSVIDYRYFGLVSDGYYGYAIDEIGRVHKIDPVTGESTQLSDSISNCSSLKEMGGFEELGNGLYESDEHYTTGIMGTPVYLDGCIYEWLRYEMSDRYYYVGAYLDVAQDKPEWQIIGVESEPEKSDYRIIPRNMLYNGGRMGTYSGKIYIVGGDDEEDTEETGTTLVSVYDPDTKQWSTLENGLPEPACELKLAESNGKLYALLGSGIYDEEAAYQQPDRNIYCYDGTKFVKCDIRLPEFDKAHAIHDTGEVAAWAAISVVEDGIVITGTSVEGYGDTFMLDTTGETPVLKTLDYAMYNTLSSNEFKYAATVHYTDDAGKVWDSVMVIVQEYEDCAYCDVIYRMDVKISKAPPVKPSASPEPTGQAASPAPATPTATAGPAGTATPAAVPSATAKPVATSIPTARATATATVRPTEPAKPTASATPSATAKPAATSTPTAKATATATARPTGTATPTATAAPTEPVISPATTAPVATALPTVSPANTISQPDDKTASGTSEPGSSSLKKSRAVLKKTSRTLHRGETYKIIIKKKNGQKVSFTLWDQKGKKRVKKKGITVSRAGLIKVNRKAVTGTYIIKVKVKKNSKYKAKVLRFTLRVKKV